MKKKSIKIPKKYTNKDPGQVKRMKKEVKKFKNSKGGAAYFQWSGDTDPQTGKRYKTKPSPATIAYQKKFGKKK